VELVDGIDPAVAAAGGWSATTTGDASPGEGGMGRDGAGKRHGQSPSLE
jgi:hypothetical protein